MNPYALWREPLWNITGNRLIAFIPSLSAAIMPIRNFWSLEPDECLVAEKLLEKLPDSQVFFPVRDIGVDLLVSSGEKHANIQVKGSRYYTQRKGVELPPESCHSWHQVVAKKLDRRNVDFYIFVTSIARESANRITRFDTRFLVVPQSEVLRRVVAKSQGKQGVYRFYFCFNNQRVFDTREKSTDELFNYTAFLDNWDSLRDSLAS